MDARVRITGGFPGSVPCPRLCQDWLFFLQRPGWKIKLSHSPDGDSQESVPKPYAYVQGPHGLKEATWPALHHPGL